MSQSRISVPVRLLRFSVKAFCKISFRHFFTIGVNIDLNVKRVKSAYQVGFIFFVFETLVHI